LNSLTGLIRQPGPPLIAWDLERNWGSLCHLLACPEPCRRALSPRIVYVGHGGPFEHLASLSCVSRFAFYAQRGA